MRRERRTARKELVKEALEVVFVSIREQPAALEKLGGAEPGLLRRLLERLGLGFCPVGRVQQLVLERRDRRRAFKSRKRGGPLCDLIEYALFLFHRGERQLERLLGRRLEAAVAAPVEIDRHRAQL